MNTIIKLSKILFYSYLVIDISFSNLFRYYFNGFFIIYFIILDIINNNIIKV